MSALDRKLARDLWRMRGQTVAAAVVIACGVALLVMSLSALASLQATTEAYYERYRFADVFASARRAPERLADRIREIPGVRAVETRVAAFGTVDAPGADEPVSARLLSLPDRGEPSLNRLWIAAGRSVAPGRADEAVLLAPFAEAHGLGVGDEVAVLMNGARRKLTVVGLALSPEFVYAIGPGALMPDPRRFGVIWLGREALAAAYDLKGAFNDVSLGLMRGTEPEAVIARLDPMLERYGGTGAIARKDQLSNWFLMTEFAQLRTNATVLPTIFLLAAAFLTNTLLGRLIDTERREIALMKAFGYSNGAVGLHYAKTAAAMAGLGVLLGWALGAWLGRWNTELYSEFFRFPFLHYRPGAAAFVLSGAASLGAALLGALAAVRRAVALAPAEAMRPPSPQSFRGAGPEALLARLDAPTRILLRQIARAPGRSLMTMGGVALAVAVLVLAMQWSQAMDRLARSHFNDTQRHDVMLGFHELRPMRARHAVARLPGALAVEPARFVPAEIRSLDGAARVHRGEVTGLAPGARLMAIHDAARGDLRVPEGGVVIGAMLAEKLGVGVGGWLEIEALEGRRPRIRAQVADVLTSYIGTPVYMELGALNRAMGDPPAFTVAALMVDPAQEAALLSRLREIPAVSAVTLKRAALEKFEETLGETVMIFIGFFTAFSGALAAGVLYNAARVALSERGRELATLRVLGFTRGETAYILLGEAALLTLAALPLGCVLGALLAGAMAQAFETELYRIPAGVAPSAYAQAALATLAAAVLAGLLVLRRLRNLGLIAVLKTRE